MEKKECPVCTAPLREDGLCLYQPIEHMLKAETRGIKMGARKAKARERRWKR